MRDERDVPDPDRDPHHELNNPVVDDPDPTEYPDPYETRPDPRGPEHEHPPGGPSTSEPPPPQNWEEHKGRSDK